MAWPPRRKHRAGSTAPEGPYTASMPELPEVETVARDLQGSVAGATIAEARVAWERTIRHPQPAQRFEAEVAGARIRRVDRRAKTVLLHLEDGRVMTVALRMTGALIVADPGTEPDPPLVRSSPLVSVGRGFAASSLVTRRSRDVIPFRRLPSNRIPVPGGIHNVSGASDASPPPSSSLEGPVLVCGAGPHQSERGRQRTLARRTIRILGNHAQTQTRQERGDASIHAVVPQKSGNVIERRARTTGKRLVLHFQLVHKPQAVLQ